MNIDIILASQSPYRKQQLEQLGLPFRSQASSFDEDSLKSSGLAGEELCLRLAIGKEQAVSHQHPQSLVIGSDQMACFNGELLGKPGTFEAACAQLAKMQGQTHQLITAVSMRWGQRHATHVDVTHLTLKKLSDPEIRRYIEVDQPLDCAGSYKLERAGLALVETIESQDHSAIMGLPLMAVVRIVQQWTGCLPFMINKD